MKNSHLAKSHLLSNKVYINLDVFSATVLNWVACHVDCGYVVTIDNGGALKWTMKLKKKLPNPNCFSDSVRHCSVFRLC